MFFSINGRNGAAEIFPRARFYFDENQCVVLAAHNIDFAATAPAKVAEEDLVTATLQVSAR